MDVYLGTICAFAFDYAPANWALCNGTKLPIASNKLLFSLLGTNFGGNGTTDFGLPDLGGRSAVGIGNTPDMNYPMGQPGGSNSVMLAPANVPAHSHAVSVALKSNNITGDDNIPADRFAAQPTSNFLYNPAPTDRVTMAGAPKITVRSSAQASEPLDITDPYQVLNYCICLNGEFPRRDQ